MTLHSVSETQSNKNVTYGRFIRTWLAAICKLWTKIQAIGSGVQHSLQVLNEYGSLLTLYTIGIAKQGEQMYLLEV